MKTLTTCGVFKSIFLLLSLFYVNNAIAILPVAACHSICSAANHNNLPPGSVCAHLNDQLIYYRLSGSGKVTFIFSSGTGYPTAQWYQSKIAPAAAKISRVFTYDRLYTFNSCPNKNNYMPNTALNVAHRLHRLLKQQHINPPYILVGHSFGGLYMLLYARLYPNQVAGLLLMDPTSSEGPTPLPKASLPVLRRLGNPQNPVPENPLYNELIGQLPSYVQMDKAQPLLRKIPLIVMYATKHCLPPQMVKSQGPFCMTKQEEHNHVLEEKKIYNMSNIHKFIRVDGLHDSFFSSEKHKQVLKALHSIYKMSQARFKRLTIPKAFGN